MAAETHTTCPYCGVGCGVVAQVADDGGVSVAGDRTHPANLGRLCSKGSALGDTLSLDDRLLHPEMHGQRCDWDTALQGVAEGFSSVIRRHGPQAVAFYVSGQLLTEDYYVANKLIKGFLGSANIDTNSRLCMSSAVAGHKRAFGADIVPGCYEDLELADLVVLAGSNAAWCHPVLFQRIRAAKERRPQMRVVVIDPRRTAACEIADLHLALAPGTDVSLWNGLLCHLDRSGAVDRHFVESHCSGFRAALEAAQCSGGTVTEVALRCGLPREAVERFYLWFAETDPVVTAYSQGVNQSSAGTDKVNAIINCHLATGRIGRPGCGPFSLTGQPNAMGGREVGGLANQLAAHMELDDPDHRALVRSFWDAPRPLPERGGLKAVELFDAMDRGEIKAVWIMATNPVVSLPDADRARRALGRCELVVVSDCMRVTDTTECAHILLPALAWGEKDGSVTNSERRISRQRAFLPAPGEARPDWWIVTRLARRMGFGEAFDFASSADIFREHAALSACGNDGRRAFDIGGLATLDDEAYASMAPVQWPVPANRREGTARLLTAGDAFTGDGRARLIPVDSRPPVHAPDGDYPLVLNTGRVRDQWHTMTRTGKAARLASHTAEPYVEVHPEDALRHGLSDHGLARIVSRWGWVSARVAVSPAQRPGSVFVPIHWSAQNALRARIGAVVNPAVDPVSGEPEFKHTPVRLEPLRVKWYGFILSRRRLALPAVDYAVRITGAGFWRYEIAGCEAPGRWDAWARQLLCAEDAAAEWTDYMDYSAGRYRGARMVGQRLDSCLFVAPDNELPGRSWLEELFHKDELSTEEHGCVLAGAPGAGVPDTGKIICACHGVGERQLVAAVSEEGLHTVEDLGRRLKAGTQCGSCVPELRALIATHRPAGA